MFSLFHGGMHTWKENWETTSFKDYHVKRSLLRRSLYDIFLSFTLCPPLPGLRNVSVLFSLVKPNFLRYSFSALLSSWRINSYAIEAAINGAKHLYSKNISQNWRLKSSTFHRLDLSVTNKQCGNVELVSVWYENHMQKRLRKGA